MRNSFVTMLYPAHALDIACFLSMREPRVARDITRRIIACPAADDATVTAAIALRSTLEPVREWR